MKKIKKIIIKIKNKLIIINKKKKKKIKKNKLNHSLKVIIYFNIVLTIYM